MSNDVLTDKQESFCREYIIDFNGKQAAIRAGYAEPSAEVQASRLLSNDKVQLFLSQLKGDRNKRMDVTADYVLEQAIKIHERCMQEVKPITTRSGDQVTDDDGNPLYAFDAKGAVASLKLVGEHVSIQAFKTQTEISGGISVEPKGLDDFYGETK